MAQLAIQVVDRRKMSICTDRSAALTALQTTAVEAKLTLDRRNKLSGLAEDRAVELPWIPDHSGFRGDKIVDDLARLKAG